MPLRAPPSDALARSMRGSSSSSSSPLSPSNSKFSSKPQPSFPSPSASILLISPTNRILLLQRVNTSSSFASAHVFPGGHVSPSQDGALPPISSPACHEDSLPYRIAAIRECFEESGLLLAHKYENSSSGSEQGKKSSNKDKSKGKRAMIELSEREREDGRHAVHSNKVHFQTWVAEQQGGSVVLDIESLVPFTRWLTPANINRRFSTQMYLYFLPLKEDQQQEGETASNKEKDIHIPTPDGGIEHTTATFLYASEWLSQSLYGSVVLFPPQFFLLSLLADFLVPLPSPPSSHDRSDKTALQQLLQQQRNRLLDFVHNDGSDPPWGEKCISPDMIAVEEDDHRDDNDDGKKQGSLIMGLANPGPELAGTGRKGDAERMIRLAALDPGSGPAGEGRGQGGRGQERRMQPVEVILRHKKKARSELERRGKL